MAIKNVGERKASAFDAFLNLTRVSFSWVYRIEQRDQLKGVPLQIVFHSYIVGNKKIARDSMD